jgi:UDPglucose 6-dehydrogenase
MNVVIVGTGYVGLTTGVALAYLGNEVYCIDIDEAKVRDLREGRIPIYEPGLQELLLGSRANLHFESSYDEAHIDQADVVFIAVGTPSNEDGSPNLEYVQAAAQAIGERLDDGFTVVVNKSTVPIGSGSWVEAIVREAYEQAKGRKPQGTFGVASNPEFLREGSAIGDTLYPDRIVIGADTQQAIAVLTELYRPILNQDFPAPEMLPRPEGLGAVPVVTTDLASAELIKYAANAFLSLKISYINEIGHLAEKVGADVKQIARGIGLDTRIGPRFLNAGLGWGGSCFPKDTAALLDTAEQYGLEMEIVQAAREVNRRQRTWAVERLQEELKILKGTTVTLLGLAFKPNTDDLRDAPSLELARLLIQRGARVRAHDPIALERARETFTDPGMRYFDDVLEAVEEADALVLVTEWPQYRKLPWSEIKGRMRRPLILDGRNDLPEEELIELGFTYIGVGR